MPLIETLHYYADRGVEIATGVLDGRDIAALGNEWERLWRETELSHPSVQWRGHVREGSKADRLDPVFPLSPLLRELCNDPRLTGLAGAALGAPAVFFKDKLITKDSGTHGYGLHQDWAYWTGYSVPADDMVTLQIAIDGCDEENGTIEVWPKAEELLPPPDDDPLDVAPGAVAPSGTLIALDPGDVLLLHPLVPHRSAINRSARPRRSYFITYVSARHEEVARRRNAELDERLR